MTLRVNRAFKHLLQDEAPGVVTNRASDILVVCSTLGPAYNEFGYNEHLAVTSRFLSIKIIDYNVKKFAASTH